MRLYRDMTAQERQEADLIHEAEMEANKYSAEQDMWFHDQQSPERRLQAHQDEEVF